MKKTIVIVVLLSILGKSFGLIRDMFITNYFGFGELTDALYIAISVVLLLFSVFNTVIRTTFSPMFSLKSTINVSSTFKDLNSVGNFISILLIIVSLLIYFFPNFFLLIISPGVSEITKIYALEYIKVLSVVVLFYGLVSILNGYLQAIKIYKTSEIAGLINNLVIIVVFLLLYPYCSYISIVYGYVAGAILQLIFIYIIFKKNTKKENWSFNTLDLKPIKEFSTLSKYLLLGAFVSQMTILADKFIASFLNSGSITALQYANTVKNLPITLVVMVVTNVLFTNLSINQQTSREKYEKSILNQVNVLLVFISPFIILFYYYSSEIIELLFYRGEFTLEGIEMTSNALIAYSFGLFFFVIKEVLNKAALAAKKTEITFKIAVISLVINVLLNILFSKYYGYVGIAASTSLSIVVNTGILLFFLNKLKVLHNVRGIITLSVKYFIGLLVGLIIFGFLQLKLSNLFFELILNFALICLYQVIWFYFIKRSKMNDK